MSRSLHPKQLPFATAFLSEFLFCLMVCGCLFTCYAFVLKTEALASGMLSRCSATEPHPHSFGCLFLFMSCL